MHMNILDDEPDCAVELRRVFPPLPSRLDFIRAMVRADDGRLVGFPIAGGAREPIERDEQPVSRVRGVIAQRVIVSIALDPFLSLKALAAYSSLSTSTLEDWVNLPPTEALPCYRLPGKILVRRSEFDAWIERFRSRGRPSVERAMRELGLLKPEADRP